MDRVTLSQTFANSVAAVLDRLGLTPLAADKRGAAVMLVALTAPAVLGMTAIAVDVGMWRLEKVRLQAAVDSAALALAHARLGGAEATQLRGIAGHELTRNGFDADAPSSSYAVSLIQREQGMDADVAVSPRPRAGSISAVS